MIFFRQNLQDVITLPDPPTNNIDEAYKVEEIVNKRTSKDVESILNHDQEPYYAIRKVCEQNNIEFHDGEYTQIMKAAYECGYGRVQAGFHYPSDFETGNLLGEKMYIMMNKADYGNELRAEIAKDAAKGKRLSFKDLSESIKSLF